MDLRPLDERSLEQWRRKYRDQLGVPVIPDLHEALCRMGRALAVEEAGRRLGYVIWSEDSLETEPGPVVPELYLELENSKLAKQLLHGVFAKLRPRTVIGRTDDRSGFALLMDLRLPNLLASPLYVLETTPTWVEDKELVVMQSGLEDIQRLHPLYASASSTDGGIAEERMLAHSLAAWRHYRLMVDGQPAAVAYVAPQGGKYITVPVIVAEAWRRRGYGRYLLAMALRRELAEGKTYVAAPGAENEAARALAESVGARLTGYVVHFHPPEGEGEELG